MLSHCGDTRPTFVTPPNAATVIAEQTLLPEPTSEPLPTEIPPFPIPTPLPTKTPISDPERRWLRGEPCFAPCWEGMTIGTVTAPEAAELLNHSPFVQDISFSRAVGPLATTDRLTLDGGKNSTGGSVFFERNKPYRVLAVTTSIFDDYPFGDVISVYGEPTHVYPWIDQVGITDVRPDYNIMFVYINKGFLIYALPARREVKPILDSKLHIDGTVTFFEPSENGFRVLNNFAQLIPLYTELVPWQGYLSFDEYCKQVPACQKELVP